MATQTLRPPNFSEDVAWVPCWLQNLRTNGCNEYVKESQAPSNQAEKDLTPSQENGINVKDFNVLSREEGGYQNCHLLLSGEDSSSLSVAPSSGNMFQFRLHLSSDVDSVFCPTHDFNQSYHSVAPSKSLSLQAAQYSVDFRENMHSMMDHHACEQDVLAAFIPETVKKDAVKSLIDTFDSPKQEKEKSKVKGCKSVDISDAVELSSAASETDGWAMPDLISVKPQNSVNSSLVETSGNSKNENLVAYLAPERFRSRWFEGWTCKELHMSSVNRNNAERLPMCVVRETSFLTESVDNVPDESSCVLKHNSKCVVNSQLSTSCEGLPKKPDESVLQSQDVVRCSSLSSIDPLCSVVPCEKLSRVEHTCLQTYSMILPDQAVNTNCSFTPCPTNQSIGGADASLGTWVSESLPASKHADENNNEVNRQYLIDQSPLIEIAEDKNDELKGTEVTQERRSPLILNYSRRRHLVDPKAAVNDIRIEKNLKQYVVQETSYQHQQNNNPSKLQVECNGEHVRVRKRVHFSEKVEEHQQKRKSSRLESSRKRCSSTRPKGQRVSKSLTTTVPRLIHSLTKY